MNKLSKLLLACTIFSASSAFAAADDAAIRTNLMNIDGAINEAVKRSMSAYSANAGATLAANVDILNTNGGNSMYLQTLQINRHYNVCIAFKSAAPTSTKTSQTVPVASSLRSKKIVLVAVYDAGDEQLSNFECVTDADDVQAFVGQKAPAAGSKSYISGYKGTNRYLGSCIYLAETTINTAVGATTLWTNATD